MKFIADSMLGRLARWLRLIGFDTLYFHQIEDRLLLEIAREEDRILLTRDTRLVKMRGAERYLLLRENDTFDQLKEVISSLGLKPVTGLDGDSLLSRCSLCNGILDNFPKEDAKGSIPEYVYLTSDYFKRCNGCLKLYWKGTHYERLIKKLSEVLKGIP